jgi:cbb3-type cytochrome oxidase cytochrome c subunit
MQAITFKSIFFTLVVGVMAISCARKSVPVIPSRTREIDEKKTVDVSNIVADTARGRMIFTNRCGRCHDLPQPIQYNAKRWDGILASMIPKANLNEVQALHIKAYLEENAGK